MNQQGARLSAFLVRAVLGVCFAIHGWPKVLDLFAERTADNFVVFVEARLGLSPAWAFAAAIAFGEALAGTALVFGLFTRLAAAIIVVIMAGAIWYVTGAKGYSLQNGGFEYNIALMTMAVSVFLTGPGAYALRIRKKSES